MSNMMDPREPQEEQFTTWENPLSVSQYVDIYHDHDPRPTRYKFEPGQKRPIAKRYDHAIHHVHNGVVIGGLAPQLRKVGSSDVLDPVLDPVEQKRKDGVVKQQAALAAKSAAEAALVAATSQVASAAALAKGDAEDDEPVEAPVPLHMKQSGKKS